jgi:acetyltransferase-like isoleucine patch superfamily enzyme
MITGQFQRPEQIRGSEICEIAEDVNIGTNSTVAGQRVKIGRGTTIGDNVRIRADEITIGRKCKIEDRVVIGWRGGNSKLFRLGDCCILSNDSRVLVSEFAEGDYGTLHNHLLVNGDASCTIGNNFWIAQNGILNANAPLKIRNGVGIGAYSAIWTHGKFGALIDGCLMHKEAPVTIEDDACLWHAIVSPGVTIGRRATVLNSSVVTKDVPAGTCFGGIPAVDLTEKINTYRNVTMQEKFQMMTEFVSEFVEKQYRGSYVRISDTEYAVNTRSGQFKFVSKWESRDEDLRDGPAIIVSVNDLTSQPKAGVSIFEISTMRYKKWFTEPEVAFMWFLLDSRARFNPAEPKLALVASP